MANDQQLISTLQRAGFRGKGLRSAYAIAKRESGGNPQAFNPDRSTGDQSYGLFQINMLGNLGPARRKQLGLQSNEQLLDPQVNARAAFQMSKGGTDFGAWGIGPNAYRRSPELNASFQKYFQQFPNVAKLAAGTSSAALQQSTGPTDTEAVVGFNTKAQVLNAEQDAQSQRQQFLHDSALRFNELLADSYSPMTVSVLQKLGGTAGMVAEKINANPIQLHVPKAPEIEARANLYGGTTVTPIDPNTPSGVSGIGDKKVPQKLQKALVIAQQQIGTPYVFGASSPGTGFDCSGLIEYAFEQAGIKTPGRLTTWSAKSLGKSVKGQSYRPGDLLITNGGEHMVMYVGGGKVIAAPHTGEVVQYQDASRFEGDIVDVRRVIPK